MFIPLDLWLPNSNEHNPVDCRMVMMQDREYQTPVRDAADLRQRLIAGAFNQDCANRRGHLELSSYMFPAPFPSEFFSHLVLEIVHHGEFSYC